jgi:hypothetical protein
VNVTKDVALEFEQLVQRGFDHHEHGRLHDALSDWETALHLQPKNSLVIRLVEFAQKRVAEIEAGEHTAPSRRDTIESPIPGFLAALTERKSEKVMVPARPMPEAPTIKNLIDDRKTPENEWGIVTEQQGPDPLIPMAASSSDDSIAPDTLEDLPVNAEDIRASANELIGECRSALNDNRSGPASLAAELSLQLAERAPPPGVDDLIEPSRALFERAFRAFMGNPHGCPIRAIPTETIVDHGLDQRAAFMMSRMDGMTSIADLIDSSGMSRFDAVRVLSALRRAKAIDILSPLP